jgi:cytochrome c oxidase cbb3-type subunit 2
VNLDFHRNHFLLYNMVFWGFVGLSLLIGVGPAIQTQQIPATPGLEPLTPEEQRGRAIYVAEGCSYCHTQQVRPLDGDRPFGRPSAAGDFVYSTPQLLGTERTGPDLANIGNRQPDETWHLLHLYNPRIVVKESVMPGFRWYFQVKETPEPGDIVVPVPETALPRDVPKGSPPRRVVATRDALALVAYLQSLKQPRLDLQALGMHEMAPVERPAGPAVAGAASGQAVYGAQCARCHQPDGLGILGVAPPMKGDPVATAREPAEHIRTVLFGASGRVIEGKQYPGMMPAFADLLTDEEIAAVINHERTSWGNNAPQVTAEDVRKERGQ